MTCYHLLKTVAPTTSLNTVPSKTTGVSPRLSSTPLLRTRQSYSLHHVLTLLCLCTFRSVSHGLVPTHQEKGSGLGHPIGH